jgi:hypothetical protein
MPSGSSENQLNPSAEQQVVGGKYGRAGFAAAFANILFLEFLTWVILVLAWYMLPVIVLPAVIIDGVVAYGLSRGPGSVARVGRGMLIGCAAAPLTVLLFIPTWIIARAFGLG